MPTSSVRGIGLSAVIGIGGARAATVAKAAEADGNLAEVRHVLAEIAGEANNEGDESKQ